MKDKRAALSLVAAVVVALLVWWAGSGGSATEDRTPAQEQTASAGSSRPATDPVSGLAYVAVAQLPPEARDTLALIDDGGPFRYDQDGSTFGNFEGILPRQPRGYYTEYTVETPGSDDRGARRIVAGDGGDFYYTGDHYASFRRIDR
jgi:ribonuclease T1